MKQYKTSISIPETLHKKHKGNFSAKVRESLEFQDKVRELIKQYPNDQMLGAVVRNIL